LRPKLAYSPQLRRLETRRLLSDDAGFGHDEVDKDDFT
jgi:hypothetical protein